MSLRSAIILYLITVAWILASCSRPELTNALTASPDDSFFYSQEGREVDVQFSAIYLSNFKSLEELQADTIANQARLETSLIPKTLLFLQGPTMNRGISARKTEIVKVDMSKAWVTKSGFVALPYIYTGVWILRNSVTAAFQLPVPFNLSLLKTPAWLKCTDQAAEHQNDAYFWYYWDPKRIGCDHQEGPHFQNVKVSFKNSSVNEIRTYPDYTQMMQTRGPQKNMQMTFAFGYVKTPKNPDPFKDQDFNIKNFRAFIEQVRLTARILNFKETPILQSEYLHARNPELQIGSRFTGIKNSVRFEIKVVAASGIDQMQLFAQSYAHDHDGFFAWFGHSRVGSEQDAENFRNMVLSAPEYYSISKNYQVIYWAGCNSYTFYTNLFFKMKAELDPENDPRGSKNLDIVSNGFSSPFMIYKSNATTWLGALINWDMQTSYQKIVEDLELSAKKMHRTLLVNVLGDEDNPKSARF